MQDDLGKLVLRLTAGGLILFHGVNKLLNGIGALKTLVADHHLPDALAYGVYLGEIVGPILVILGLFSRVGAILMIIDMLVALALVHTGSLLNLDPHTGGYALELQAFYLFSAVAVALLGAGRIGIGGGRWN